MRMEHTNSGLSHSTNDPLQPSQPLKVAQTFPRFSPQKSFCSGTRLSYMWQDKQLNSPPVTQIAIRRQRPRRESHTPNPFAVVPWRLSQTPSRITAAQPPTRTFVPLPLPPPPSKGPNPSTTPENPTPV